MHEQEHGVFPLGEKNEAFARYFVGQSYLSMLTTQGVSIGNVTFEPKTRTNWHKHSGGQILLVLSGEGRYQERGKPVQIIKKGDVVRIPPEVEHWHGGGIDTWMTHISVETNVPNNKSTWLEPVSDEDFMSDPK